MSRKPDAIDIVKLYAQGSYVEWNAILTNALRKRDINKLISIRQRLQAGMAVAAKQKMNSDNVVKLFIRLQNSIEKTIKQIVRLNQPNPCDNPLTAMGSLEAKPEKKKRDEEMEKMLRKTGY